MYNKGNIQIILTTSRKEEFREKTIQQLRTIESLMIILYLIYYIVSVI